MATTTIKSGGAYISRASGSIVTAGDFSIIGAYKWSAAVGGNFPCAFALQGISGTPAGDWLELFQDDPSNGDDIFQTWQEPAGSNGAALGTNAALVGKWIHCGYSYAAAGSNLTLYAILEGFNPASPVFLLNTTVNVKSPVNNTTFLWNDNALTDNGTGVSIGHWLITGLALSQTQMLAQFGQRAPTATVSSVAYSYLDMTSTTPTTDLGSIGSNFTATGNTGGTQFTIDPTQPSDWNATGGVAIPVVGLHYVTA